MTVPGATIAVQVSSNSPVPVTKPVSVASSEGAGRNLQSSPYSIPQN